MVRILLHGPQWFFGIDAVMEVIAGIVALLIVLASYRYMRLAKDPRYGALGGGFLLIFIGFVSQVISTLLVYQQYRASSAQSVMDISNTLFVGHAAQVLFFISGLLVLVLWALRVQEKLQKAFIITLTTFAAVLSVMNPTIFHLLSLALLLFLCAKFFLNAIQHDTASAWGVLSGFSLLTIARLAFLLEPLNDQWYVGGHAAQLAGYIILLLVLVQVVRK